MKPTSDFGDSERGQRLLELLEVLDQLFLLLSMKFVRLNLNHLEFLGDSFKRLIEKESKSKVRKRESKSHGSK